MIAVLCSGGMDSAAALYLAVERHGAKNVQAVFVNYGQKAVDKEMQASCNLACAVGVPYIRCVWGLHGGTLLGDEGSLIGPDTVVPGRNRFLIMQAQQWGDEVWFSPHSGDWAVYEDCRPEFVRSFTFPVVAPFLYLTKRDIVQIGNRLGVPWELTWSCYAPTDDGQPCGACGACIERTAAMTTPRTSAETRGEPR